MEDWQVPPEWQGHSYFGRDGLLYLEGWRRGFTAGELRTMFFDCQQVRSLRHENARLERERAAAEQEKEKAEQRAAFYRRQCILEARLGMCLSRIA